MYLFVQKEIRGVISYIAKRYSKGNNKYMKFYDNTQGRRYWGGGPPPPPTSTSKPNTVQKFQFQTSNYIGEIYHFTLDLLKRSDN